MSGYGPTSAIVLLLLGVLLAGSVAAGLCLTRRPLAGARLAAWVTLAISLLFAEEWTRSQPGGLRMLAICGALFFGFKSVVGTQELAAGGAALAPLRWLGFVLAWPGMNPGPFAGTGQPVPGGSNLLRRGSVELLAGLGLIGASRLVWLSTHDPSLATAPLLLGLSLVFHFGLFGIAAGLWRRRGVPVVAPFQAPLSATNLAEFWSRRWNRPFSELIQRTIYRPVLALAGRPAALGAGFLLSGVLHELALSVPARSGYGRPLAYFALQGGLVLIERARLRRGRPPAHRAVTLLALTLPLPLLLIPEFLRTAIWPIVGIR